VWRLHTRWRNTDHRGPIEPSIGSVGSLNHLIPVTNPPNRKAHAILHANRGHNDQLDLHCLAQIVALPLPLEARLVYLAGGDIVVTCERDVIEALIVAEVEVNLRRNGLGFRGGAARSGAALGVGTRVKSCGVARADAPRPRHLE
jgi:hypothetical protein